MSGTSDRYTNIGCGLWTWDPWVSIEDPCARLLWLGFYSSPQSKRLVPGLWTGTPHAMADMIRMPMNETWNGLERLISSKLVEHDSSNRVVRMTVLPDATERAHNDRAIRGWWTKFLTLPNVHIRNIHVHVLWWLVSASSMSEKMSQAWNETFGTVMVPENTVQLPPRDSGLAQGLLFQSVSGGRTTVAPSGSAPSRIEAPILEISGPLVVSLTTGGPPVPEPDQEPDPDLVLIGAEEDQNPEPSGDRDQICITSATPPPTALVPFSVAELLTVVAAVMGGEWLLSESEKQKLQREICALGQADVGLLGDYLRGNKPSSRDAADLLTVHGALASAFSRAARWRQETDKRNQRADDMSAELARLRAEVGV